MRSQVQSNELYLGRFDDVERCFWIFFGRGSWTFGSWLLGCGDLGRKDVSIRGNMQSTRPRELNCGCLIEKAADLSSLWGRAPLRGAKEGNWVARRVFTLLLKWNCYFSVKSKHPTWKTFQKILWWCNPRANTQAHTVHALLYWELCAGRRRDKATLILKCVLKAPLVLASQGTQLGKAASLCKQLVILWSIGANEFPNCQISRNMDIREGRGSFGGPQKEAPRRVG